MNEVTWLDASSGVEAVTFRVGRTATGAFVAEWPDEARLEQIPEGWRFDSKPGLAAARAEKLERGAARAIRRYFEGEMSLHASAVDIGGRAIVFLGPSGAGKSTTAARLCAIAEGSLLADDVLAVRRDVSGLIALPTEAAHWLELQDRKQASAAKRPATTPAPVVAIVLLDVNESPIPLQPILLRGRAAMLAISSAHITLPIATRDQRRRDFEWLAGVCERVPIVRVVRRCAGDVNEVASTALRLL